MGSVGEVFQPGCDRLTVDVDISAVQGRHGLSIDTFVRTVWAITKYVYTGDNTLELIQYTTEKKALSKTTISYNVENSMSVLEVAASEQKSNDPPSLPQEPDDDSSAINLLSLVKRTALLLTKTDNVQSILDKHAGAIDKSQNLLCIVIVGDRSRMFLHFPRSEEWKNSNVYLADTIKQVFDATLDNWDSAIRGFQFLGPTNQVRILETTGTSAMVADITVADIITQQAEAQPRRPAIDAWDGRFTYDELLRAALRLAAVLQIEGIAIEERVPLCMKKSKWAVAAMSGILLAGGTCVPLDINSPPKRLLALTERLKARFVVADQTMSSAFADTDLTVLTYPSKKAADRKRQLTLPKISPSAAAFVFFTSGSTGTPKGVVSEHGNMYAAIRENAKGYHYNEHARVFQYSAYVFDVSIGDMYGTLMNGGCVCIPSEEARMDDPAASMAAFAVTHACFTPTVLSYIEPSSVPTLQRVFVGGEALDRVQVLRWLPHVDFNVIYGTTESLIWDSLATAKDLSRDHKNLGRPIGPCLWVVDADDSEKLRPLGAIGEILTEGPLLARGYMDDPASTAAAFISAPAWMKHLRQDAGLRCYRTGDLGYRNADGTVSFVGRANTQVKIRGQRVELGEIEHSITTVEPSLEHVAVDSVKFLDQKDSSTLAAFIYGARHVKNSTDNILAMDEGHREIFRRIQNALMEWLPRYMVPSLYFPIAKVPRVVSGKLDRKVLKHWASEISPKELTPYYLADAPTSRSRPPETAEEKILQQAWAKTMKVSPASVGAEDHFFESGGNSIKAMELVATIRDLNRSLSVATIFQNPRLSDMAAALGNAIKSMNETEQEPFSLISDYVEVDLCVQEAARACKISEDQIEDIYKTTPMQEALLATSANRSSAYYCQLVFEIPKSVDLERLKSAWESLVTAQPIFRTRICVIPKVGSVQIVTRLNIKWGKGTSLDSLLDHNRKSPMTYGTELSRYAIVRDQGSGNQYFVWSGHHAIYDGWSQPLMFRTICQRYLEGEIGQQVPYRRFIQYLDTLDTENAIQFWKDQFPDVSESFPKLPAADYIPQPERSMTLDLKFTPATGSEVTAATLIQAAWALVAARHIGSADAVFGLTLSGRDVPVTGVTSMLGPTITTVPLRINLDNTMTVTEYLRDVQALVAQVRPYQHLGLQNIRQLGPEASSAVDFQTLVVIHPNDFEQDRTMSELGIELVQVEETDTRDLALTLQCILDANSVHIRAQFDEKIIDSRQLESLLYRLEHVLSELTSDSEDRTIYEIDMMSSYDLERLAEWNSKLPPAISTCIHTLVEEQTLATPDAQAISGFDEDYTYSELNVAATRLAGYLSRLGVQQESRVVLCFGKSSWPIIAMLAVLKSGGACVSVNPDHPLSRLQEICDDVQTKVLLCDEKAVDKFKNHVAQVVAVNASLMIQLENDTDDHSITVLPSNASFVVYTSGSTGKPKGSVLEHQALCTSLRGIALKSGMNSGSRTLQFSAYTFDAHILEIFGTLLAGGCICVISDDERMNHLTETILKREVNWSLLTPTVARLLKPEEVASTLKTLILSGEPLARQDVRQWADQLCLLNGLGPSECSILACLTEELTSESEPANIGHSLGCHLWITDPRRRGHLVPLGTIGELTIEGPIIGREYVNRPKATKAAFIVNPAWSNGTKERPRRFYRTGDLAKFNMDGSVTFIGRADSQVKIRGQRVELGEIEHYLKFHGSNFAAVVVDVLKIAARADTENLVAFIVHRGARQELYNSGPFLIMNSDLRNGFLTAQEKLNAKLPRYMVPSMYLPVQDLPVSASGKLERKKLREWVSSLSAEDLAQYHLTDNVGRSEPTTEREIQLLRLCSQVLKIPEKTIGVGENFFQLGGDSVTAMQLIAAARAAKLSLTVADVFQSPQIGKMAKLLGDLTKEEDVSTLTQPFDLIRARTKNIDSCIQEVAQECQVESQFIEDIYPCTPIQEALMAISAHKPQAYTHRAVFCLPSTLELNRFRSAWDDFVATHAIFRTRIVVQQELGAIQVVLKHGISWRTGSSLDEYLDQDRRRPIEYGGDLSRFAVIDQPNGATFVWTVHHATYDGWSLARVFEEVCQRLKGQAVEDAVPYKNFVRYLDAVDKNKSDEFWRDQFPGYAEHFPRLPSDRYTPKPRQRKSTVMQLGRQEQSKTSKSTTSTTMANIMLAAWALVTAPYTDGRQAHFGLTLSGRDATVAGITEMMGPTITTVPMRIHLDPDETASGFLQRVQAQVTQMRKHQHAGLQRIRRLSPQASAAIEFQNLVVVQTVGDTEIEAPFNALGLEAVVQVEDEFSDLALATECVIRPNEIRVNMEYDSRVVSDSQAELLLKQLEHALSALLHLDVHEKTLIRDINLVSPFDLKQIDVWHGPMPEPVESTVHGLFEEQVARRPNETALSSFDGECTYLELDTMANALAYHLVELGIGLEDQAILCFNRSSSPIIAMLAVLKSGGVCVSVNPQHPTSRLLDICHDAAPEIILCDQEHVDRFEGVAPHIVVVDIRSLVEQEAIGKSWKSCSVPSTSAAFTVYTSGTTGMPKGTVLEHRSICTSLKFNGRVMKFSSETRALQFSAYTWDSHIVEIFCTLIHGGCVCLLSEEERTGALVDTINTREVNWACLTPTVARLLPENSVPGIKTFILVGEPITRTDIRRWVDRVQLLNGYGPTECSVCVCCNNVISQDTNPSDIGRAISCHTWITDPENPDRLMPIGAIGEILVEGAVVAREYLNRPDITKKAFITDPRWSRNKSRPRRFYRTGDLARLMPDGSLNFIGRADTQVKIRGQRVELSEIEYQARVRLPSGSDVVTELVQPKGATGGPTLAAFVYLEEFESTNTTSLILSLPPEKDEDFRKLAAELQSLLAEAVPEWMVPSAYIPVSNIPNLPSGKTDRARLRKEASSLTHDEMSLRDLTSKRQQPENDIERDLQTVWARVLNLSATDIGVEDTFNSLGGDSITAMQVVADCRRRGIKVTVPAILKKKTIVAIAPTCLRKENVTSQVTSASSDKTSFTLSPIQRQYFAKQSRPATRFNQSLLFRVRQAVSVDQVRAAWNVLVERHSMLRARFRRSFDGEWQQNIVPMAPNSYRFKNHIIESLEQIEPRVRESSSSLDIVSGPVFSVDYFSLGLEVSIVFLAAHRLVIDSVSWQIISQDFEAILQGHSLATYKSLSFRQWCEMQDSQCRTEGFSQQILPSTVPASNYAFWRVFETDNIQSAVIMESFNLDAKTTNLLLKKSNAALRTQPIDILLGLLMLSFRKLFVERDTPTVLVEDNGRTLSEDEGTREADITEAVGWFTTMYSVYIPLEPTTNSTEAIRSVKDIRYLISEGGRSSFSYRNLSPHGIKRFKNHDPVEMLVNFKHNPRQSETEDGLLELETRIQLEDLDIAPDARRWALIDVDIEIHEEALAFVFRLHRQMAELPRVREWIQTYHDTLSETALQLSQQAPSYTLSDFPLLDLTYAEIDDIMTSQLPLVGIEGAFSIQNIYPCTAMQEGMLLSQQKDRENDGQLYQIVCVWQFRNSYLINDELPDRVKTAWQSMVQRHSSLRTEILPVVSGHGNFLQVVLHNPKAKFALVEQEINEAIEAAALPSINDHSTWSHLPHLSLYRTRDGGVVCRLELSHVLADGTSMDLLISEFVDQLTGHVSSAAPMDFIRFVEYERSRNHASDVKYWSKYLKDVEACQLPSRKQTGSQATGYGTFQISREATENVASFCQRNEITPAALLQTAWAIVLGTFTGLDDVCLGYFASDRDAPLEGVESAIGLLLSIQICRIRLTGTTHEVLRRVQHDIFSGLEHRNCPLASIYNTLPLSARPLFNTCLTTRRGQSQPQHTKVEEYIDLLEIPDQTEYAVALYATVTLTEVTCDFTYQRSDISAEYAGSIGSALETTIRFLTTAEDLPISSVERIGATDRAQLEKWTAEEVPIVGVTVHGMIEKQVRASPDAFATNGFDGDYTYAQIDQMATSLAANLIKLGLKIEARVVLCLKRSTWPTVAMLGVLKAGGVCVSVNPEDPRARLLEIYKEVEASIVLCDTTNKAVFASLADHIITIDYDSLSQMQFSSEWHQPDVSPQNAAFVVYTSGTTGKPKGCILEHQGLCTSMTAVANQTGMNTETRTLQYSVYTFDAHILEIFGTWMVGGCVYIASERACTEKLADVINTGKVNWSLFIPTLSRAISPEEVPTLKTLILGGDIPLKHDIWKWAGRVQAFNAFGTAECSIVACMVELTEESEPSEIGHAVGCHIWITEHANPDQLVPIGCVGEILIEGPIVGRGYVNRSKSTTTSFITDPAWSHSRVVDGPQNSRRFYRTGDLGRFNADGSISFVGRGDTQVKIDGQRVELGEIEHQIKVTRSDFSQVTAEVSTISSRGDSLILAAFVQYKEHEQYANSPNQHIDMLLINSETREDLADVRQAIRHSLPLYMVPELFIPVRRMPHLATGKLNRKALQKWLHDLTLNQYAEYSLSGTIQRRSPTTATERLLQQAWAKVLSVPVASVGAEDHFFQCGGDSARAMKLTANLREMRYKLSVAEIFRTPRLCDLAATLKEVRTTASDSKLKPFSLIPNRVDIEDCISDVAQICKVDASAVEDLYPATPMQEALVAVSTHQAGLYHHQMLFKLPETLDLEKFKSAWQTVATIQAILRTRIVHLPGLGSLQAVLRSSLSWRSGSSLQKLCENDRETLTLNGAELSRFAIVSEDDELTFVWTLHHALFDRWSLSIIFEQVGLIYQGQAPPPVVSYAHFIRYLSTVDHATSDQFWRQQFAGATESYPLLPSANYSPNPRQSRSSVIDISDRAAAKTTVTTATLIQAAYALTMAQFANTTDASFGIALSGRDAPVPGIADMAGPTLAIVSVLIRIDRNQPVAGFLRDVQNQVTRVQEHQHVGLHRIRRLSPEAKAAAKIQNLLIIQNRSDSETLASLQKLGLQSISNDEQGFLDLALGVECVMHRDRINIVVQYDSNVVPDIELVSLLRQLKHNITTLLDQSEPVTVKDLDLMPADDLRRLQAWNYAMPETVATTLHELVEKHVMEQPDAIALSGPDGEWTYDRLNDLSTTLAMHLTNTLGCQPETRVILCFAKSVWPIVAMLAVLKSGGVCVSVNPDHPRSHLLDICDDCEAAIVLCDGASVERFSGRVDHIVTINETSLAEFSPSNVDTWVPPAIQPSHAAFIVYTSGSTGKPKGTILEHQGLCSSLTAVGTESYLDSQSRVLQFSAYTFDAHLTEIFGALIHGGCICVISDDERHNNLTGAIQQRKVNWAVLTPTVARLLLPEEVPELKRLTLVGEPLTQRDITQWASHLQLFNSFGPSECSIAACITRPLTLESPPSTIGFSMGCHLWIVDRDCPDNLIPIGRIGEIVIEGPILGRGYINRPEATDAAFVYDLAWSQDGSGRKRRFYRTGDLGKLNHDGSITYIGRIDLQVKIRGQRVELEEIESRIHQLLPSGSEALVEYLPATGTLSEPTLVAFLQVIEAEADCVSQQQNQAPTSLVRGVTKNTESDGSGEDKTLHGSISYDKVVELRQSLGDILPEYMVPAGYIPITFIPSTPSGKTDRRRLRSYAQDLTLEDMHMRDAHSPKAEPTTDMERELRSVWSQILNHEADQVSIDETFTSLGGDSITAMQVVAECRKRDIKTAVSTILDKKTIRRVAPACKKKTFTNQHQTTKAGKTTGSTFNLSPVQQLYFTTESPGWTQFNQSFLLRVRRQVSAKELQDAFDTIVDRHGMLRARFIRDDKDDNWQQSITPFEHDCYRFETHQIKDLTHEVEPYIQKSMGSLDIVQGPVFSIEHFEIDADDAMLFMVAHHLVIDLVSWRVIWRDLEEILQGEKPSKMRSLSFQRWCEVQEVHTQSQSNLLDHVLPLPTPPSEHAFWEVDEAQNTLGQAVEESFDLDANSSGLILGRANDALRTAPLDIMLGLLILSFQTVFTERTVPSIFIEQHGREVWETDQDIDISETVGWFTAMYPLHVPLGEGSSATEAIRLAKDLRRRVPGNGRPYFACRHLLAEGTRQFAQHDPAEMVFNFAGMFQQLETHDSLLENETRFEIQSPESAPTHHRWAMIDLNAGVSHGVIQFSFVLHREMAHLDRIRQWIQQYKRLLSETAVQLADQQPTFTLSDFPLLKMEYNELADAIAKSSQPDNIQDIFPLSFFQREFVEGNLEKPPRHQEYMFVHLPSNLDISRLQQACRKLVNHFDSLRTIFVRSKNELLQIVLKNVEPQIDVGDYDEEAKIVVERWCEDDLLHSKTNLLGHSWVRFKVVCTPKQNRLIVRLSHAQFDGMSAPLIDAALTSFYEGETVREPKEFVEYIHYCHQHSSKGYEYWRSLLQGSKLTSVPRVKHRTDQEGHGTIRSTRTVPQFKNIPNITPASVFSAACGILLASITDSTDIVFGRLISGRAGLDAGMQDIVGACVNIVPVRVHVTEDTGSLLSSIQRQHIESIAHETVGLDEIIRHCTAWSDNITTTAAATDGSNKATFPVIVQFGNSNVKLAAEADSKVAGSAFHSSGWDQTLVHPFPSSLCLAGFLGEDGIMVSASAGVAFCVQTDIESIAEQLCDILAKIME